MMSKRIPNLHCKKPVQAILLEQKQENYNKRFFVFILGLIITLLTAFNSFGQIAAWDFTGFNAGPATVSATVFNSNLVTASGANNITRGATAAGSTANNSFRTTGFQNNGISTANTDYFQITLQATATNKLSLSTIDARFNGTATYFATPGVTSQFAYSLNGTTFTLIGSPVQTTSLTMTQISLTGISALQNVPAGVTVTLRYYASGQTATGGWGFFSSASGVYGLAIGGSVDPSGSTAVLADITQPTGAITQGNNDVVLSGFKITPSASVDFTAVTVSGSGTATATDITAVRIFRDNNANGLIDGADASVSGSGVAYAVSMPVTITGETGFSAVRNYLIVANVAGVGVSAVGHTVTTSIASGAFSTTATVSSGSATGSSRNIIAPPGTSTFTAGPATEPAFISSLVNTQGAATTNFDFTVTDDGATPATDNATTQISQIVFNAGTGNTITNWTLAIAGAELSDGVNTTTTTTIGTSTITFAGLATGSGAIGEVADNASKTYTLKIWLKTDLTSIKTTVDGQNFVFRVQNADLTTTTGSQLTAGQDVNSGSTNNVFDVTASALIFGVQPSAENTGVAMTPAPTVIAVDANGNRDLGFTSFIRINSTGTLAGSPVDVAAVSGVATFSTLIHTAGGIARTLTAQRTSTLDWSVTSGSFDITAVPVLTEIILPQYSIIGSTTASRNPYVCRLGLSNLIPNATYRYITGGGSNMAGNLIVINNAASGAGYIVGQGSNKSLAGTLMSGNENNTSSGRYGEFTTDATGAYTGWFSIVPSGNATFTAGSAYNFYIQLNNGAGGTAVSSTLNTTNTITSLNPAAGTNSGRAIRGASTASPENMIFLYDNTAGTGRPIAGAWAESDGLSLGFTTWYDGTVDGVAGSWGTYIPSIANGIRRIEQRNVVTAAIVDCVDSSSTGVWPSGATTVSVSGGTTAIVLTMADAPFTCPIFNTITTGTVSGTSFCIDEFTGAAVSVPFTSTDAFGSGNIYTAQLSNASGSFTSAINIGTLTSNANSGTITAQIPGNTPAGSSYRIRVISSSPAIVGSDNGTNIAITSGTSHYIDIDGDGYGDDGSMVITCVTPGGYIDIGGDCDDFTFAINPAAAEVCDELDNNCNTQIDEGVQLTFYADADADTYGNSLVTILACTAPVGYVSNNTDCNDTNNTVNPGATEVCGNGVDDDCDTFIDEGCSAGVTLNLNILIQGFYAGGGTMISSLFNLGESIDPNDVDSITVELHSLTDLYTPFESFNAILKSDGTASCTFTNAVLNNSYYIVVKHRSSLETWSKDPVLFSTITTYDFIH